MKYIVRMEFNVESIDFLNVDVEATSREEAIQLALKEYYDGDVDVGAMYASDDYNSEMRVNYTEWDVEEIN